jgi:polygalacturonase
MSNLSVYLAPGCLIRIRTGPPGENVHTKGLWIDRSRNIRIFGRGYIDQQAYEDHVVNGNAYNHLLDGEFYVPLISQAPLLVMGSQDVALEGLCVRNSRVFSYNVFDSDRVTLRHCKALTPAASSPESTDCIDVDASDSVTVEKMLAFGNDDCFAWGNPSGDSTTWGQPAGRSLYHPYRQQGASRDLIRCVIRGMVGWNPRANALRFGCIGGSSPVGVRDIPFRNCDFAGSSGSAIFLGSLKASRYLSVKLVDCGFDTERATGGLILDRKAQIGRLELRNVVFSENRGNTIIEGPDDDTTGELTLRNVRLGGEKLTDVKTSGFLANLGNVIVE